MCEESVLFFEEKKRREACRRAVRERWYHETHTLGIHKEKGTNCVIGMHNPRSTRAPPIVPLSFCECTYRGLELLFLGVPYFPDSPSYLQRLSWLRDTRCRGQG